MFKRKNNSTQIAAFLNRYEWALVSWAGLAAFLSYCCMYMYRKPFTAGTFEGETWMGADYKIALVIAQVIGYAISKFVGIKLISELRPEQRSGLFLVLMICSQAALIGLAFTPPAWGVLWLFLNGLPLGMIWGIVFSYLEGRKMTEILTVIISANFIFSSGLAKSIGSWFLNAGFSGQQMPMIVGLLFFPVLLFSIWMLLQIPPPSLKDQALRSERKPMNAAQRWRFFKAHAGVICLFIAIYLLLTIVRDVRDNFAVEIWTGLGYAGHPALFVTAEIPIAILAFVIIGAMVLIRDNRKALAINLLLTLTGGFILILATWMFAQDLLSPVAWMIVSGAGLFIPYILFNGIIFDRYIGNKKVTANVGFLMYSADTVGYLGSVAILLWRNFGDADISWLSFYLSLCYVAGAAIVGLSLLAAFRSGKRRQLIKTVYQT